MSLERVAVLNDEIEISTAEAFKTTKYLTQELRSRLEQDGATQIPSFVARLPNGSETGEYLAVDLGGTNCRVCLVQLHGDGTYTTTQSQDAVPLWCRVNSDHEPLFCFIAEQIREFLIRHPSHTISEPLKLGFTFSFTYTNQSLSAGMMVQWDKGWNIPSAIGRDPCELLQRAINDLKLSIQVVALTNDTIGTLMCRAYTSRRPTLIGAIFGTGTNAAYVEKRIRITKLDERQDTSCDEDIMIINTEWGAFCDSSPQALRQTRYDEALDAASSNPRQQLLEKQISGLYLGELLRLIIVDMWEGKLLTMTLDNDSPMFTPYAIETSFLSQVLQEGSGAQQATTRHISTTLHAQQVSIDDAKAIAALASALVRRAARLGGIAITAIIVHTGRLQPTKHRTRSSTPGSPSDAKEVEVDVLPISSRQTGAPVPSTLKRLLSRVKCCFTSAAGPSEQQQAEQEPVCRTSFADSSILDIGIDGSLFECLPGFERQMREVICEVLGTDVAERLVIGSAKDGSGIGAALVAQSTAAR